MHTFKYNTLISGLLLQLYLFNIHSKLHYRKRRKLRVAVIFQQKISRQQKKHARVIFGMQFERRKANLHET